MRRPIEQLTGSHHLQVFWYSTGAGRELAPLPMVAELKRLFDASGAAGELEHGALWHVPGGYAMRHLLGWTGTADSYRNQAANMGYGQPGNALAIVPSTKKVGAPGCTIDIPLTHINASYVRSHFDAFEMRVPGAPRADEMVVILAMSTGPRVHARVGGLKAGDISKWDGQR